MNTRFVALAALLLLALPLATRAQDPPDTTRLQLDRLLEEVVAANPTLQAARLEAAALAKVGEQVGTLPDPSASVTAFPYPVLTARGQQRSQWRVEQPIPWPGTLALRRRAADLSAEVAEREAEVLALDLAFEVKQAYYDLNHAHHLEAVVRTYQERLNAFAEAAAIRYEVGRGPQGAILQVQLERQRLGEQLNALTAHRTGALQTLARLTDRPGLMGNPVAVSPPGLPDDADMLIQLALRQRPEVRALEVARARAEAEVALAKKAFYPDPSVGIMYMDMIEDGMGTAERAASGLGFMVGARLPLQRGRLRARLEEAELRRAQVEVRQQALETELRTQIVTLARRAREALQTLVLFQKRLQPQAAATVEATLASYTTGQVDYIAFLDAERTRFQVQLAATDAYHDYLTSVAALERALGVGAIGEALRIRVDATPAVHSSHPPSEIQ